MDSSSSALNCCGYAMCYVHCSSVQSFSISSHYNSVELSVSLLYFWGASETMSTVFAELSNSSGYHNYLDYFTIEVFFLGKLLLQTISFSWILVRYFDALFSNGQVFKMHAYETVHRQLINRFLFPFCTTKLKNYKAQFVKCLLRCSSDLP